MIERAIREFESTHALLWGSISAESAVVEAVASVADDLVVEIDPLLAEDHPIIAALDSTFERTEDDPYVTYHGSLSERDRMAVLSTLLSIDDWHRGVSLRTLVLASQGRPRLLYTPDHRSLEIDAADTPAIKTAARGALDGYRALVVSTATVAEWTDGGTEYALSPPWLCVGRGCLRLSRLLGVESDPETRTIALQWSEPSYSGVVENDLIRPLIGAFSFLASDEPAEIRLSNEETYTAVEATLSEIVTAFQ